MKKEYVIKNINQQSMKTYMRMTSFIQYEFSFYFIFRKKNKKKVEYGKKSINIFVPTEQKMVFPMN